MPFIRYFSILVLIYVLSVYSVFGQAETFPFLAEIQAERVNIRAGENENFEKIGQLIKGNQVIVVFKRYHWYKIELPLIAKSYVSEKYIQLIDDKNGVITTSKVNVRCGPTINNSILGQLDKGAKVSILGKEDKFYKIIPMPGSFGWIDEKYVAFKSKDISGYQSLKPVEAVSSSAIDARQSVDTISK